MTSPSSISPKLQWLDKFLIMTSLAAASSITRFKTIIKIFIADEKDRTTSS